VSAPAGPPGAGGVRAWRLALGAVGLVAIAFGVRGVLTGGVATDWPVTAGWLLAGVLLHDLVLFPAVAAVGWLLARAVPTVVRPVVRGGLVLAALVTAVALPVLTGRGDPTNASLTPLDYPRNLALVLLAIAVGTAALAVLRWRRAGREPAARSRRGRGGRRSRTAAVRESEGARAIRDG
jgi:hypothetical protein